MPRHVPTSLVDVAVLVLVDVLVHVLRTRPRVTYSSTSSIVPSLPHYQREHQGCAPQRARGCIAGDLTGLAFVGDGEGGGLGGDVACLVDGEDLEVEADVVAAVVAALEQDLDLTVGVAEQGSLGDVEAGVGALDQVAELAAWGGVVVGGDLQSDEGGAVAGGSAAAAAVFVPLVTSLDLDEAHRRGAGRELIAWVFDDLELVGQSEIARRARAGLQRGRQSDGEEREREGRALAHARL